MFYEFFKKILLNIIPHVLQLINTMVTHVINFNIDMSFELYYFFVYFKLAADEPTVAKVYYGLPCPHPYI